jgi:hypothetical protein
MRPRKLILRTLKVVGQALILVVVASWFLFGGVPVLVLMAKKEDIMHSLENSGIDTSECRRRKLSILEPNAGVPGCFESSYKDLERKVDEEFGLFEEDE